MAQPYAAYPPAGSYYPPGYDYSGYYQQQQAYDPNQAYWQQQYPYGAAPAGQQQQAAPPAPAAATDAPPLPADEPPPLPPPDEPTAAAQPAAAATSAPQALPAQGSAAAAGSTADATSTQPQQQQQQASQVAPDASNATGSQYAQHAAHYGQYPAHYGGGYSGYYPPAYGAPPQYGAQYGAQPPYGAPAGYGYPAYPGSYDPAAPTNSSYAPQVHQQHNAPHPPSAPYPGATQGSNSAADGAAAAAAGAPSGTPPGARASRWNRAAPPASLIPGASGKPSAIRPATIVSGSTAAAAGGLTIDAAGLSAAISAATAAAASYGIGGGAAQRPHQQQQQFIPVGRQQQQQQQQQQQHTAAGHDLPPLFGAYAGRALKLADTQAKMDKLRDIFKDLIAKHRQAGTLWSTDWDRMPLPVLPDDSTAAAAAAGDWRVTPGPSLGGSQAASSHHSVFDRLSTPKGWEREQGGKDRRAGRYSDSDDDDSYEGGRYKRGRRGDREWDGDRGGRDWGGSRRAWDEGSRRYSGSGSDSDDERSDSYDRDDGAEGARWGYDYGSGRKKQRVDLQAQGGRGRGKKGQGQQDGGRGQGRGRGRGRGRNQQQGQGQGQGQFLSAADRAKQAARSARFGGNAADLQRAAYGWEDDGAGDDGSFIVGTCQTLEKRYLRLTRPPAPEEVRPQPVLAAALSRLLRMIEGKADKYLYYNDQFKAMRQDLTVQGIKNDFTVQVYEAHGRAALEYGDFSEYNQCQAQLAILYAKGLAGSHTEFGAYRLLYQSVYAQHGEGRKLLGTLRQLLGNRVGDVAASPEVAHAMQVRQALACGNVLRFFSLYATAPRLSRRLMDAGISNLRFKALRALVRTHKPTALPLTFLATSLGFLAQDQAAAAAAAAAAGGGASGGCYPEGSIDLQLGALTLDGSGALLPGCSEGRCLGECAPCSDTQQGLTACLEWCVKHGAVFDTQSDLSAACLVTKECWNKLLVPVDTSKVAHGDANLDIRDFLAVVS